MTTIEQVVEVIRKGCDGCEAGGGWHQFCVKHQSLIDAAAEGVSLWQMCESVVGLSEALTDANRRLGTAEIRIKNMAAREQRTRLSAQMAALDRELV